MELKRGEGTKEQSDTEAVTVNDTGAHRAKARTMEKEAQRGNPQDLAASMKDNIPTSSPPNHANLKQAPGHFLATQGGTWAPCSTDFWRSGNTRLSWAALGHTAVHS